MFFKQRDRSFSQQKSRRTVTRLDSQNLFGKGHTLWPSIKSCGVGYLQPSAIDKVFLIAKRLTLFPNSTQKFWVNIQLSREARRRAPNLRMGKGIGSVRHWLGKIKVGVTLVAFTQLRSGLLTRLCRQVQSKCSFKVAAVRPAARVQFLSLRHKKIQANYISTRQSELIQLFTKTNKGPLVSFLQELFKWSKRLPKLGTLKTNKSFFMPDYYWDNSVVFMKTKLTTVRLGWGFGQDTAKNLGVFESDIRLDLRFWTTPISYILRNKNTLTNATVVGGILWREIVNNSILVRQLNPLQQRILMGHAVSTSWAILLSLSHFSVTQSDAKKFYRSVNFNVVK